MTTKQYAPEFLSLLADECRQTTMDYLRDNGAPAELVKLIDDTAMLTQAEYDKRVCLDGVVEEATQLIAAFGGEFHGGGSTTGKLPVTIPWPGK